MKAVSRCWLVALLPLGAAGCSGFRQVSAEGYHRVLERPRATIGNTFPDEAAVIGETQERVYLEYRPGLPLLGPRVIVYWVPRSELTAYARERPAEDP